jgi:hypothetical protein
MFFAQGSEAGSVSLLPETFFTDGNSLWSQRAYQYLKYAEPLEVETGCV